MSGSARHEALTYGYSRDEATAILDLLGVEWKPLWEKAEKSYPEPKDWKGLKTDDAIPEGTDT